ncbi:hypothetical protein QQ020_10590 [Fulvivirgaceae bacterium BMA12]|uniref:Glycosyltransferase n=1 Tax=Agaribacillus aureus TaxID=3051825 RepID=A0ABT8L416_9BACT|nr:hypothetical protein [Fulvivirgaceae bacterium BMA12]
MIRIFPIDNLSLPCPVCGAQVKGVSDYLFTGVYFLARQHCPSCTESYLQTLPVGHAHQFPISLSGDGSKMINENQVPSWWGDPLLEILKYKKWIELPISKKILRKANRVVLLNCMDDCFGHVFWKLLNADRHLKQPDIGLILIIPASFMWLVPEGVAELWVIDAPLSRLSMGIQNLDAFLKEEIKRFDEVYLSKAYVHLDHTQVDISKFIKTKRFDLNQFEKKRPQITFIMREDRFWLANQLDEFFYKVCIKFKLLSRFKGYFIFRQNRLFNRTANALQEKMPDSCITATGLGTSGRLNKNIVDRRVKQVDLEMEKKWCDIYAQSHIVFGVHGSNMIIPTSLAAGFINILPHYKIDNMSEDIAFSSNTRYTLFLGRHLAAFVRPWLVVRHMISMIKLFPQVKDNMDPLTTENS